MGSDSRSSKRKKKRSQKRSKKSRSSREKTKKLKRRHASDSSSREDVPSTSSLSCYSYSSEEVYRCKKRGRSHDRRDRKSRKKRTKIGRSMSVGSGESPRVKKRKKLKSNRDSNFKKKKRRKIQRRGPSINSSSSPSRSFEACEPSNDSGRKFERRNKKLEMKKSEGRELSREMSVSKSRHGSRSCSPYGVKSHMDHSEEGMEYQPKRLKSVIVAEIEREEPEVEELNRDSHKDEIVYEHDDYPSKSNDSYDGASGRDAVAYSDDAGYVKTGSLEDPIKEAVSHVVRVSESSEYQSLGEERTDRIISSSVGLGVGEHVKVNEGDIHPASAGSNPGNLEANLRQKALENLLRRQGKLPANISTDKKDNHRSEVKSSSSLQNVSVLHQSDEEGSFQYVQKVGKNVDVEHTTNALGAINDNNVHPRHSADKVSASGQHAIIKPKLDLSTSTRRLLGSSNTWRRELTPQEPVKSSQSLSKESDSTKDLQSPPSGSEAVSEKVEDTTTSEPSPSGVKSSTKETNEDDEDAEFQQKTMSVMRGGEMVQVSYKVRIPKKAPALARRQLKR